MADDIPRLPTVIKGFVDAGLGRVHTALPATIVAYNATTQKATVQLAVRFQEADPDTGGIKPSRKTPPIPNIPVIFPSGNNRANSITWPMVPGDPVLLVVSERSTDEYRAVGAVDTIAQSARRFNISDAVAIPGYRSFNSAVPTGPLPATAIDALAMVIKGSVVNPVKIGDNTAVDFALKGTTFMVALNAFMTTTSTATLAPQIAAAAVTFLAAIAGGAHLSTKVKIS